MSLIVRDFDLAKDVYLIDGKIYVRKPKPSPAARGSTSTSSKYRTGIDLAKILLNG